MRIYSDYLAGGLRAKLPDVVIRDVVPKMPRWAGKNEQSLRVLRYLVYPLQARREDSNINHITEAGYAHLIRRLDPARTVVTVHDLIPLLSWRGVIPGLSYPHPPRLFEHSLSYLKRTAAVITPSERIRADVIKYCGCDERNVHVVHHGIDERFHPFSPEEQVEQRKRWGLPLREHLILISGDQAYKNHDTCIRVLERARRSLRRDARLVRVGRRPGVAAMARNSTFGDPRIIDLGQFAPDVMPSVYNAVDALLFPSWYEGFGWPPLEAMACGVPVVASNAGSIPEIVGDAGYLCAPDDVATLTERICQVLEDLPVRAALIESGCRRAREFNWDRHVERLCDVYAGILSNAPDREVSPGEGAYLRATHATSSERNGKSR